ncbi:CAP domain-containing protein [Pseudorhodobacter sp.]|uniref:CAP domain-containing protein n=1 Tax=Pseudorhodobacter sp. TaxID=1934400 RepID=UPI0026493589|nr:CAP domain-containing protein [Pseudorhodobacter sp.]MDN5788701.1 CAP domain-containing protein [Pseudorhodobacter sp.]
MNLPPLAFVLCLCAAPMAAFACPQPGNTGALLKQAQAEINAYRKGAGLRALSSKKQLADIAQQHACDMAGMGKHSHVGSDGSDLGGRLRSGGYRFGAAVENVGKFSPSTDAAQWWYKSAGHRANILSPQISDIGLGVALGTDNKRYWVMLGGQAK